RRIGVPDVLNHAPNQLWNIDVGSGRDLAGDDADAGRDQRLARDAPIRIVGKHGIENRVRNLVRDFIRVAFGHRFRRENVFQRENSLLHSSITRSSPGLSSTSRALARLTGTKGSVT